jgi:hypothetical protein
MQTTIRGVKKLLSDWKQCDYSHHSCQIHTNIDFHITISCPRTSELDPTTATPSLSNIFTWSSNMDKSSAAKGREKFAICCRCGHIMKMDVCFYHDPPHFLCWECVPARAKPPRKEPRDLGRPIDEQAR